MPATLSVLDQFAWDSETLRYRRSGRFVSERAVKLGIRRVIRNSQAEMRALSEQMVRGEITLSEWQGRFSSELKNLHVSGAMAGQGGPANMTQTDYLRVGRTLKQQYRHLNRFATQIRAGELDAREIHRRTEMYINSMNGSYEGGRQSSALAAGFDEERNILGFRENHCHTGPTRMGCIELTEQGWVRIGTMPVPGQRQCLSNCGCSLRFRKLHPPEGIA